VTYYAAPGLQKAWIACDSDISHRPDVGHCLAEYALWLCSTGPVAAPTAEEIRAEAVGWGHFPPDTDICGECMAVREGIGHLDLKL
jgi:hypothetical protein